jgi:hypothetical protein
MARAARFFRQDTAELMEQARAKCPRDPETNAIDEARLITEIEKIMPFDAVKERHEKAKRLYKETTKPRKTEPHGSEWLPGFEPVPHEPLRMMPDDQGKTVETDLATAHFTQQALARSATNLQTVTKAHARNIAKYEPFHVWAADQKMMDRPSNEITLGNFLRETGLWRADEVSDDEEDDD